MKNLISPKENRDIIFSLEENGFEIKAFTDHLFSAIKRFSFADHFSYINFHNSYDCIDGKIFLSMSVVFVFGFYVDVYPSIFDLRKINEVIDYYEYLGRLFLI